VSAGGSVKVTICIATFRRPEGLRQLLESISAQRFGGPAPSVSLVIVDNDPEKPIGRETVQSWSSYPVTYLVEPQRGLANVRNRALNEVAKGTDFIAFVDDDEQASPEWLSELLRVQKAFAAAAVQGPVKPRFAAPAPRWMEEGGYFELGPYTDGQPLLFAGTNNSLVDWRLMNGAGLRFDMRFNLTGGEDQDLFVRLRQECGGTIVAAAKAIVYDEVPLNRMSRKWVLRRWFRIGNTLGRIAVKRRQARLSRAVKAMARIARGGLEMAWGLVTSQTRIMHGLAEMSWGAGTLFAYLDLQYDEYGKASYRPEPASPEKAK